MDYIPMTSHAQPVKLLIFTLTSPPILLHDELLYIANTVSLLVASNASTTTEQLAPVHEKLSGKFPCQKV